MSIKFIVKSLDEKLYVNDIPLSYEKYGKKSFIGILMKGKKEIAVARCYDKRNVVELADIYISEQYRGKGYGDKLIKNMLNNVKNKRIIVWTTSDNNAAINLHKKNGFIEKKMDKRMEKRLKEKYKWIKNDLIYFIKEV